MRFEQATSGHEPALRQLMRTSVMPGTFRLAYAREPDLALSLGVEGTSHQVLAALEGDQVVGMGVRALRPAWVNGQACELGYLGGLRSLERVRGGLGLAKGYRFLRDLHRDGRTPGYLTTILEGNAGARALLTSHRAGMPHYLDLGRYTAHAVLLDRRRNPPKLPAGTEIVHPPAVPLDAVLAFLDEESRRRQFGPIYGSGLEPAAYYRDFRAEDFYVALRGGTIVGVAGVWDQRAYKQTLVDGYGGWVRPLRPLANRILGVLGYAALPEPGAALAQLSLAFIGIRGDDPAILAYLLEAIHRDHREAGFHSLLVGFHERDPLRAALRPFLAIPYHARLCWVGWEEDLAFFRSLEPHRIPTLELARL